MKTKYSKFNITTRDSLNKTEVIIKTQETNDELGTVLAVCESSVPKNKHTKITDLLNKTIDKYFNKQDLINPSTAFEEVLHEFNKNFNQIFNEQISWTKKINITVLLILKKEMHFANYGQNRLLLLKNKRWIDIIQKMNADNPIVGKNIFEQIYSGNIENFYRIFLCNNILFDYLNNDKIKESVAVLPLQNIPIQIEQLLSSIPRNHSLAGSIFEIKPIINQKTPNENNYKQTYQQKKQSIISINNLINISQKTTKLLKPQTLPDWQKIKNKLNSLLPKNKFNNFKHNQNNNKYKIKQYLKNGQNISDKLINISKKNSEKLFITIKNSGKIFQTQIKTAPENIKYTTKTFIKKFKGLPKSSKYLLITAILLLLIFGISIVFSTKKQKIAKKNNYYQQITKQIEEQHNKAKAAIIYGDRQKAREFLHSSANLIFSLPKDNEQRQKKYDELIQKNEKLMLEINHIVNIEIPVSVLDLKQFNIIPSDITINKNKLIILDKEQIINYDLKTKQTKNIKLSSHNIKQAEMIVSIGNINIIYENNGNISRFDAEKNEVAITETKLLKSGETIKGIDTYKKRLYFLDKKGQIWRMNPKGDNYYSAKPWLKEKNDFNNANDLTVDGEIYVLYNNGKISKFTAGRKIDFELENIDPILSSADKIYTNVDIPYIYILDNKGKRLIVFNKEGKLIKQYISNSFKNLKNFIIDYKSDKEKTSAYLMTDSNIYQILIDE